MNIFTKFNNWNNKRQTQKLLSRLTQRELDDIGIYRNGDTFERKGSYNVWRANFGAANMKPAIDDI